MWSNGATSTSLAKRTQRPLLTLRKLEATETRTGRDTKIRGGRLPYLFLLLGASKWPHSLITCNATLWKKQNRESCSAKTSSILLDWSCATMQMYGFHILYKCFLHLKKNVFFNSRCHLWLCILVQQELQNLWRVQTAQRWLSGNSWAQRMVNPRFVYSMCSVCIF